jgi:hypothetical protein
MHRFFTASLFFLACFSFDAPAHARSRGIAAANCGCHNGGSDYTVSLSANADDFAPGANLELAVTLSGATLKGGGVFVTTEGVGTLHALPGEGLGALGSGLSHTTPKAAAGGQTTFRFGWTAPSTPGAVRFTVATVGADMNNRTAGDLGITEIFDFVYGCEPEAFYYDADGDGYGRTELSPRIACRGQPPPNYAANPGDCDDFRADIHPGAPELCDGKDNDCDSEIDEDAEPVELWPDEDGDGYYAEKIGEPLMGCVGIKGYAALGGDCGPNDPAQHPGAEEICNFVDDNCDGQLDERVRPTCGEGWCRRESVTCKPEDCTPGKPSPEICNLIDDDCDGVIDNDATCPDGRECVEGECVASGAESPEETGGAGPSAGGNGGKPSRMSKRPSGCSTAAPSPREITWALGFALVLGLGFVRLISRKD